MFTLSLILEFYMPKGLTAGVVYYKFSCAVTSAVISAVTSAVISAVDDFVVIIHVSVIV